MSLRSKNYDVEHASLGVTQLIDTADVASGLPDTEASRPEPGFPIVGIVASAGGLEAFKSFFKSMPSHCGLAFVVVPHLDAKHKSLMAEVLARQTTMPVVEATEGQLIEKNSVYVIPPNHCLSLSQGRLHLSDLPKPIGAQTAIDYFLRSLAADQGDLAIGIVLSGTGSHGTLGIREVKRCGGMTMVQSPETAEFDQMPRSAIETGLVDFVLPPVAMPATLRAYAKHRYLNRLEEPLTSAPQAAEQLQIILELIRTETKYDFRSYRTNMILRRIERRMGLIQLDDLAKYTAVLHSNPGEMDALCNDFLIGVTTFFREPEAFAYLENVLIPELVNQQPNKKPLRVWVPSCATGEEAYSIAILLLEAFAKAGKPPHMQFFASDISQRSIAVARRGIYPASITVDVSTDRLTKFFLPVDELHFQVSKQLRDSIVFSTQNVISDAPFSNLDLISCRNLMIYLEPETQQKLVSLFHYALNENGCLLLGTAETVGRAANLFKPMSKQCRIYGRVGTATQTAISLPEEGAKGLSHFQLPVMALSPPRKRFRELAESVLRDVTPAAVLINQRYEVLYVSGAVVNYLEFPAGELTNDLMAMARTGLRTRLRTACHKAFSQQQTVTDSNVRVQRNGSFVACIITARPLLEPNGADELLLVTLQDHPGNPSSNQLMEQNEESDFSKDADVDTPKLVHLLEYELKSTREELQNTIEDLESANEELQSSNEELESSKEELQSLNEELSTVNCQLLEKISELHRSNGEITSLMASTDIATLYLDQELHIKRFTHPSVALFSLVPTDVGRDIRDFASKVVDNKLVEDCQQVLQTREALETEIFTKDKQCFLRRITPFRTPEQLADGVVVTFVNISVHRKTLDALQQSEERIRTILKTASDAIITIDNRGLIDSVNESTEAIFGYASSELVGQNVSMLMLQPFRREHDGYLQRYLTTEEPHIIGKGREVICRRKDGSTFPADLAVSQVDHLGLFTGILRDISSRKVMQKHILDIATDEQRRIGLELHDGTQQELTGLTLYANALLETIQSAAPHKTPENAAWMFNDAEFERLKSIANLLSKRLAETNQHVRELAHGIMPIQIDAEGLRSALTELVKSINSNEKISCDLTFEGEVAVASNTTATHLYRIAQEAVNNALRHGSADQIKIRLSQQHDQITLEVSDNGVGFDHVTAIQNGWSNKGMGMRTMEYRASLIGGRMEIERSVEGGALVRCQILQGVDL